MPNRPFRFLHASDFRLDAVPRGLTEVPDHLRDTLLDAPFQAAKRVFDTALVNAWPSWSCPGTSSARN